MELSDCSVILCIKRKNLIHRYKIFFMKRLFHFSEYLREKYNYPLQRIAIDLALGCPNRTNGGFGAGCIFCSEDGARARHLSRTGLDLAEQVQRGVEYVKKRYGASDSYIAYLQ